MRKIFLMLIFLSVGSGLLWAIDLADLSACGYAQAGKNSNDEKPQKEALDKDLDELDKELKPAVEDTDVLEVMREIEEKMIEAAECLSRASIWKAFQDQEITQSKIDEIIKKQQEILEQLNKKTIQDQKAVQSKMDEIIEKQQEALEQLKNLFQRTRIKQIEALDDINELIRLAREVQMQSSQSQSQQQQQQPQQKPQQTQIQQMQTVPRKPRGPATRPYEAKGFLPPRAGTHTDDITKRWGNLPPKLREAILQSKNEEFLLEYMERLKRYFKILSEEE